jgi:hypothetical protein
MSDKPVIHSEDLGNTEYDGNRRARAAQAAEAAPTAKKLTTKPVTGADEASDVGLAQRGDGEAAAVRKETEI